MNKQIKILSIIVISIILLFILGICIYDSDWYINKTIQIKEGNNIQLSKKIKYNYISKYENGSLKIRLEFFGVEKDVFELASMTLNEKEFLIRLKFSDQEGFKIAEKEIFKNSFTYSTNPKGAYIVHAILSMDKQTVRKIKYMDIDYRKYLTSSYDEVLSDIMKRMYLKLVG